MRLQLQTSTNSDLLSITIMSPPVQRSLTGMAYVTPDSFISSLYDISTCTGEADTWSTAIPTVFSEKLYADSGILT